MRDKKFPMVSCYYCGKLTRYDKAVRLYVTPRVIPELKESEKPEIVMIAPKKIYICPSCARYRGISRRALLEKEKKKDLLKKLGIEI